MAASSETRFNDQEPGALVPLTAPAGVVLWDWAPSTRIVEPFLHNDTDQEQRLTLGVYRARCEPKWLSMEDYKARRRNDLRDTAFTRILTVPMSVPPRRSPSRRTFSLLPSGLPSRGWTGKRSMQRPFVEALHSSARAESPCLPSRAGRAHVWALTGPKGLSPSHPFATRRCFSCLPSSYWAPTDATGRIWRGTS